MTLASNCVGFAGFTQPSATIFHKGVLRLMESATSLESAWGARRTPVRCSVCRHRSARTPVWPRHRYPQSDVMAGDTIRRHAQRRGKDSRQHPMPTLPPSKCRALSGGSGRPCARGHCCKPAASKRATPSRRPSVRQWHQWRTLPLCDSRSKGSGPKIGIHEPLDTVCDPTKVPVVLCHFFG